MRTPQTCINEWATDTGLHLCVSQKRAVFSSSCGFCGPEDNYGHWAVPGSTLAKPRHAHLALLTSYIPLEYSFASHCFPGKTTAIILVLKKCKKS